MLSSSGRSLHVVCLMYVQITNNELQSHMCDITKFESVDSDGTYRCFWTLNVSKVFILVG